MLTLDLARAHIRDLHRQADRDRTAQGGLSAAPRSGRLRRLMHRVHA